MTLFLVWFACSLLASCAIILTEIWAYTHPKPGIKPVKITLHDVGIGVITAVVPILNIVVVMVGLYYLATVVIPELKE
jgi:uncharacterized BrkB/YihY/UPF0761 family membrane protein